jgi:kynurenine formamidase
VTTFVDLTHEFHDGMPGFRMDASAVGAAGDDSRTDDRDDPRDDVRDSPRADGHDGRRETDRDGPREDTAESDDGVVEYTAHVEPFLTHEKTRPLFDGRCSFEITELRCQTSVGTYVDAPVHRHPGERDVSDLALDDLIAPGVVVDTRGCDPYEPVGPDVLPDDADLEGAAVLFDFGWSDYWGTEQYREYPYVSRRLLDRLVDAEPALVGVDTINVDDDRNPDRPAHTRLLGNDVLVVENLRGLDRLHGHSFRFQALPVPVAEAAAMPVRAVAELDD